MSRRGRGEGTAYKRPDGRWAAQASIGYGPDGRRRRVTVYGATKAEALAKLRRELEELGAGANPTEETVEQYLRRWLRDSARLEVREATLAGYEANVRLYIAPAFGRVKLRRLLPVHIQELYASMIDRGLSPRTVKQVHAVLHRALDRAVRWGLISRNPADAVDLPRGPRPEMQVLTPEQVRVFLDAARDDRLYALYALAVTCGPRQGELLGLPWDAVNFEAGTITIRQQLIWPKRGQPYLEEPKTAAGRRTFSAPKLVLEALKAHRRRQAEERLRLGEAWQNRWNLVFTTPIGTPLQPSNLVNRSFHPLLERAGLPRVRFHDLRHTAASLMAAQGVPPDVVRRILGHSSITITYDVYAHVFPQALEEAASKLDALLG